MASVGAEPPPEKNWGLDLHLYGIVPAVEYDLPGTATDGFIDPTDGRERFPSVTAEQDLDDAFDEPSLGVGGVLDFHWWRMVGTVDGVWAKSESDDGDIESTLVEAMLGFRVLDIDSPLYGWWGDPSRADEARLSIDLMGGARYWNVDPDLDEDYSFLGESEAFDDYDWVDPIVGAVIKTGLLPSLYLRTAFTIGGFDIGNASELSWSAHPMLVWQPFEHFSFDIGYKSVTADRSRPRSNNDRDAEFSGPHLGLGIHF